MLLFSPPLLADSKYSFHSEKQLFKYRNKQYELTVPDGYQFELMTDRLDGPRMLSFDAENNLLIASKSGAIYRLAPPYRQATILAELDNYPHSITVFKNMIYVAQTDGVYKADYSPGNEKISSNKFIKIASLPDTGGHNSRTLALGTDNLIYVSLGITANCSDEFLHSSYPFDLRRGGVYVFDPAADETKLKMFANGLRNPVGFDWHPVSQIMYSSNNGPDHLGFDLPPEYFSEVTAGSFHGMPWYQYDGDKIIRDGCIKSKPPYALSKVSKPVATFDARNAPMGVAFFPEDSQFSKFANNAVVALRGSWATRPSWNAKRAAASRRHPKLMLVVFNQQHRAIAVKEFITGFQLENGNRLARPVGVKTGPDGALYITSDYGIEGLFRLVKIK